MSRESTPSTVATIGIDLGKNTFHLVGLDQRGPELLRPPLAPEGCLGFRSAHDSWILIPEPRRSGSVQVRSSAGAFHLPFSASEVLAGVAVSD
jgi:hypothetical protein